MPATDLPALLNVPVNLGTRSYTVQVGRGLLPHLGQIALQNLGTRKKCAVITNPKIGGHYLEIVKSSLEEAGIKTESIIVPSGENSKSLEVAQRVCSELAQKGLDRHSFIVALGGGVIGDLAGFCAGIYQRGIPFIQVPTTVLSQVDSSVGGKTGVNLPEAKNMVGVFHQPSHVVVDIDTLNSLNKREYNSGFAEIIKHACIRDADMFTAIEEVASGKGDLAELIRRNIAIKAAIVEADEYETLGLRALLNYGHTLGHAIENAAGYSTMQHDQAISTGERIPFLHGEAISLGLHTASWLSVQLCGLPESDHQRTLALLRAFDLPTVLPPDFDTEELLRIAHMDKKFESGKIRFVLLRQLGDAFVSHEVTPQHLIQALDEIRRA